MYRLQCVICNRFVEVIEGVDIPVDAVMFRSSTTESEVFDPDDNTFLEIVVCDPCLEAAGQREVVSVARDRMNVRVDVDHGPYVGYIYSDALYAPVPWHKGLPGYDEHSDYWIENVEQLEYLPKNIHLTQSIESIVEMLENGT